MHEHNLNKIYNSIADAWKPPTQLTVDEWADAYRKLSPESSAEAGQWHTSRLPFQREIMKTLNDPNVEEIVFMKSAQVGATEIILNIIGFYIHQEPTSILCLQPTLSMAQTFSKDRLAPMLRDTPVLKNKVKDPRTRDAENTTLHKKFNGGHITIVGANSASGLASRPIRIVLCDEVDRYPISAGTEGDPIKLATKRTTTFYNRKIIMVSTPTIKTVSRIEKAFNKSDQRYFHVPCPECHVKQKLEWANLNFDKENPENAAMTCSSCGSVIPEIKKQWMLKNGEWVAENTNSRVAGFHISELYSPFRRWSELVEDFLEAKQSPEMLQTFINTSLGECWEEQGEEIEADGLMARRENYNEKLIPEGILVVTAGVDIQSDRIEIQTIGFGKNYEAWVIQYKIIFGDPSLEETWEELDDFLQTVYKNENGQKFKITATCVDSGGHHTAEVYKFTKARTSEQIFAVKGSSQAHQPIASKIRFVGRTKAPLIMCGTDTAKEWIMSRLNLKDDRLIHFSNNLDEEYFKQLTSEKRITKKSHGKEYLVWKATRKRNEGLDTFVYALCAVTFLTPQWKKIEKNIKIKDTKPKEMVEKAVPTRQLRSKNTRIKKNFANSWKE